ncbi:hypothetical protein ONE63_001341 [Megalurothrips usitatus]|uniref:Transmembrane protein 70 homolog, mitochondrial n=1 Tax=Megalurothrips usitatus TaxID=439358 RepID=A0AAV7XG02_9NEOP|nr:hypothetical protein ONE63_001341 [Megalurothrips usitatus]
MLRVLSSRCFGVASSYGSEQCLASFCCARNLTSINKALRNVHLPLVRSVSTGDSKNKDTENIIIYKGRLEKRIVRVKIFSLTTSALGIAFQPILYNNASSLPVVVAVCSIAGFFTFVTPILLNQLTKRHVNTVTYNAKEDTYVAHTTTFFFKEKLVPIKPGEGKIPESGGMFTSMEVRGIPLLVEMEAFEKHHLVRILGYDKPLDLKSEQIDNFVKEAEAREAKKNESNNPVQLPPHEDAEQIRKSNRS